jgi:2-polyprenyl-3-methyl-5-hydroxy-6-metoxy-1,4-benzoquinol methylase
MEKTHNIEQKDSQWIPYNKKNKRDETMAQLWIKPLLSWLSHHQHLQLPQLTNSRVLDFGCGYLDLGIGLHSFSCKVDGFDIDPWAREVSQQRLRKLQMTGQIFQATEDIPDGRYDIIVVNSVFQYLRDLEDLRQQIALLKTKLAPKGCMLICDLIPSVYSPQKDAFHSLYYAFINGCFVPMLKHLWYAATKKSNLKLLQIDRSTIFEVAQESGFICNFLDHNLTPSPYRYSVVFSAADERCQPLI